MITLGTVLRAVEEKMLQRFWGILAVVAVRTGLDSDAVQVGIEAVCFRCESRSDLAASGGVGEVIEWLFERSVAGCGVAK